MTQLYVSRNEYCDAHFLIYLRFKEGTERFRNFTKVTSSDYELLTNMIGAEILKTNKNWRAGTVENVENPE